MDACEARGDLLVYVDADCRAPLQWLERIEHRFARDPELMALSGNYRFYDWDWWGRPLLRAYDLTLGPATHVLVKYVLQLGVVFYGGNFAVRRAGARADRRLRHSRSSFTARTRTSAGACSRPAAVELAYDCYLYTSARRYNAMGKGAVFRLYVRNFVSEIVTPSPKDSVHLDIRSLADPS